MADNQTETVSPTENEQNDLPATTVTETRDIVAPHSDASNSLEKAFEDRAQQRTKEQEKAGEAAKPEKAAEAEKPVEEPEKADEPEETDPRKRIAQQIEEAEKESAPKPEPEAEAEPEDGKEEAEVEETPELTPRELKALKEKTRKRMVYLSSRVKSEAEARAKSDAEIAARESKIKELEGRKPEGVPEDVQKQLDELAMFRRQYQLENSPEIKTQFDNIVADGEKFIGETLKGYGIGEPTIKMIEAEGGFAAFSRSHKTAQVDGEAKTYAEIARDWLNGMNVADAESIRAKLGEQRNTLDAKKRFIDAEKGKASEYFKTQSAQHESSVKAQQEAAQQQKQKIESFLTKATTETEWMKEKEIPATATPEQRKEIEIENKRAKDFQKILAATLHVQTLEELFDAALDSVAYHKVRLDLAKANKRIKELEAKESKRKAASATTTKQGSIASPPPPQKRKVSENMIDAADAFELALERKALGEE